MEKRGYGDVSRRQFLQGTAGLILGTIGYGCGRGSSRTSDHVRENRPTFTVDVFTTMHLGDEGKANFVYHANDPLGSKIDGVSLGLNGAHLANYPVARQEENGRLIFSEGDQIKLDIDRWETTYKTFVTNRVGIRSDDFDNGRYIVLTRSGAKNVIDRIFHEEGVFENPGYRVSIGDGATVSIGDIVYDVDFVVFDKANGKQTAIRYVDVTDKLEEFFGSDGTGGERAMLRKERIHTFYPARMPVRNLEGEVRALIRRDFVDPERDI